MRLNDLIEKGQTLENLREEAINNINELKEVGRKVAELQRTKWQELQTKCIDEAIAFYKEGGFNVEYKDKLLIAKYNNIEIKVKNDSVDEMLIFPISIMPQKVYNSIEIRPCNDDSLMFYQKNNLKIGNNNIDFNNYISIITNCNEEEKLEKLIKKTEENIFHFRYTIDNFNEISYIYSIYDTNIECSSFKEVFENYI